MSPGCKKVKEICKLGKQIAFRLFCFQTRLCKSVYSGLVLQCQIISTSIERNKNKYKNKDI